MTLRPTTRTFATLSQNVKRIFGDEAGVQLNDVDIARWANDAQTEIVNSNKAIKGKATLPTVAGTATYTFPAVKIQQIESLHYDNGRLENLPFAEAESWVISNDPAQTETGTPSFWYEWNGEITVWPKPDAVKNLTLYFTAYPDTLTGDTAQLLGLPDKFYNATTDYVLMQAYRMDEDQAAADSAEQRFRNALDAQMEDERQAQNMTYPIIQEMWGY